MEIWTKPPFYIHDKLPSLLTLVVLLYVNVERTKEYEYLHKRTRVVQEARRGQTSSVESNWNFFTWNFLKYCISYLFSNYYPKQLPSIISNLQITHYFNPNTQNYAIKPKDNHQKKSSQCNVRKNCRLTDDSINTPPISWRYRSHCMHGKRGE